jgi:hypothetical protein
MQTRSTAALLLGGGFLIGCIDALYATGFWSLRGVPPSRIFQSIAAGLLGRSAYSGGAATAWLGFALHYFIAIAIVVVYWLASARLDVLIRRWLLCGVIYGLGVYAFMNYIVMPLSAAGRGRFDVSWFAWSVLVHALLVGVPAAFFARAARGVTRTRVSPQPVR